MSDKIDYAKQGRIERSTNEGYLTFKYRLSNGGFIQTQINRDFLSKEMQDYELATILRIIAEEAYERGRREENEACAKEAHDSGWCIEHSPEMDSSCLSCAAAVEALAIEALIRARLEEK